jgi:hypothetical protein
MSSGLYIECPEISDCDGEQNRQSDSSQRGEQGFTNQKQIPQSRTKPQGEMGSQQGSDHHGTDHHRHIVGNETDRRHHGGKHDQENEIEIEMNIFFHRIIQRLSSGRGGILALALFIRLFRQRHLHRKDQNTGIGLGSQHGLRRIQHTLHTIIRHHKSHHLGPVFVERLYPKIKCLVLYFLAMLAMVCALPVLAITSINFIYLTSQVRFDQKCHSGEHEMQVKLYEKSHKEKGTRESGRKRGTHFSFLLCIQIMLHLYL